MEVHTSIEAIRAKDLWKNQGYTLIDVRTPVEYQDDHIEGAILIPIDELKSRILELDKNKKYIVICRSGNRSSKACDIFIQQGFSEFYSVKGGLEAWNQV
ncbi:hypothetical protein BHU72_06455 [Desulfuribacillus stibiiarsenatis]|uniref:Rhodanese domain-containing protein n=1 Tax=Desulfuribacillus stibiiarsenatis TaxID=1390249 RepID=A0A1E5L5B7_9FIRM|nr:hypothetical protein BHU72_06455 [Desulfuribacillus stibiiarsenatis]